MKLAAVQSADINQARSSLLGSRRTTSRICRSAPALNNPKVKENSLGAYLHSQRAGGGARGWRGREGDPPEQSGAETRLPSQF